MPELDRCETRRELLAVTFGATGLQLVAGPLVLLTLPPHGLSWVMIGNITGGLINVAAGVELESLSVQRVSLEEVYLTLTDAAVDEPTDESTGASQSG